MASAANFSWSLAMHWQPASGKHGLMLCVLQQTFPKLAFGLHHGASERAVNKATTAIGETDPLTWALPRTCSSRQSDLALTFIPVELGTLLALCLWKTTALRHLHRDKAYFFSLILISGPLQTIKGMSHSREPNREAQQEIKQRVQARTHQTPGLHLNGLWGHSRALNVKLGMARVTSTA